MTINPLSTRRTPTAEQLPKTPQELVALFNQKKDFPETGEPGRQDISWVVGHDGQPKLEFVETDFDRQMARIKQGNITQGQIDRLPFNIRRIAWNRGYLNCDYGEPPRYWLPGRKGKVEAPPERTGLSWHDDE